MKFPRNACREFVSFILQSIQLTTLMQQSLSGGVDSLSDA
jgi:hypothetical protein